MRRPGTRSVHMSKGPEVVLASGNPAKLAEMRAILAPLGIVLLPQSDFRVAEAAETGATFFENAGIKARNAVLATGLPAIADDSGLVVDALNGAPGVYSARFAGADASDTDNVDKLLAALSGVPDTRRGAAFECVACFARPDSDDPMFAVGSWHGKILPERRGTHGFGYDPVFFDVELGCTAAEMAPAIKNARSHRGRAMRALARKLDSVL